MPALVFYGGYRSFLAGDDIGIFTKIALLIRIVQLIVLVAITIITAPYAHFRTVVEDLEDVCDTERLDFGREKVIDAAYGIVVTYFVANYVTVVLGVILEVAIARAASQGTPVEQDARAALRPLCFLKMGPLSLLRLLNLALGVMSVYVMQQRCSCAGTTTEYTRVCPDYYNYQGWVSCILFTHFLELIFVSIFALFFLKQTADRTVSLPSCIKEETKWKLFCMCCCTLSAFLTCCLFGGTDNDATDFADIGIIMADFFDGSLDVALSDIILGIRMVARQQRFHQQVVRRELINAMRIEEGVGGVHDTRSQVNATLHKVDIGDPVTGATTNMDETLAEWLCDQNEAGDDEKISLDQQPLPTPGDHNVKRRKSVIFQINHDSLTKEEVIKPVVRSVLSSKNPKDVLAIAEGVHFVRLCNGIYEFYINHFRSNLARLLCNIGELGSRAAHLCCTRTQQRFEPSSQAGFRLARYAETKFLKLAGLEDAAIDLEYVQFRIGLARTPYIISVDHDWKSVVVTIRGTYSLDDVVADLTIRPASMDNWGKKCNFDGTDCFVHAGMLRCSAWIYDDLEW
jgi:sn1-specific diacylglycerol lipase